MGVVVALLSGYGCDDNGNSDTVAAPSGVRGPRVVAGGVSVRPAVVEAQMVADPRCPFRAPFFAPIDLIFAGGISGLSLRRVELQFVDTAGLRAAPLTITQPEIATRFGSAEVPAFGSRSFPLAFPYGCAGAPAGTLTVVAETQDRHGRSSRRSLQVPVRQVR
jgi:hypothetical protein